MVNKGLGTGTVVEVGNYVKVDFNGTVKILAKDKFFDYNKPEDQSVLSEIDEAVKEHNLYVEEQRKEAANRAAELAEQRRKEAEERKKVEETSRRKPKAKKAFDEKFGADYNLALLTKTPVFTYKDVEAKHDIQISGFGRGINPKEDCVVLISTVGGNSDHFTYHDKWNMDGHYEYSGEGSVGDQTLSKGNKAIVDAAETGKPIYLYVKFAPQEYYPQGIMKLLEYKTIQAPDKNGDLRKEYVFILDRM
ncbi:MAG: hypothetical protein ACI35S_03780 [Anaeroplasma sp.]